MHVASKFLGVIITAHWQARVYGLVLDLMLICKICEEESHKAEGNCTFHSFWSRDSHDLVSIEPECYQYAFYTTRNKLHHISET